MLKSLGNERIQICQIPRFNHRIKRSEMIFHDDTGRVVATRIFLPRFTHRFSINDSKQSRQNWIDILDKPITRCNKKVDYFERMKLEQPRATRATKSPDPSIEPCHPIIRSTFNHQVSAHQTFLMQFPVRLTMKSGS